VCVCVYFVVEMMALLNYYLLSTALAALAGR